MSPRIAWLLLAGLAGAPISADEIAGEAVYNEHCVHCHGDSKEAPGTLQLAIRRGEDMALLTEREDLVGPYVEVVVRNGLNAMPAFAPSHLTKDDLEALVDYLTGE